MDPDRWSKYKDDGAEPDSEFTCAECGQRTTWFQDQGALECDVCGAPERLARPETKPPLAETKPPAGETIRRRWVCCGRGTRYELREKAGRYAPWIAAIDEDYYGRWTAWITGVREPIGKTDTAEAGRALVLAYLAKPRP